MATSNLTSLIPPGACESQTAWTSQGQLLYWGSLYAVVVALACTILAYKTYHLLDLRKDAQEQIQRLGTLWVISTFFLALGVFVAGHVVQCNLGCSTYASECGSISCVVANFMPEGYVVLALLLLSACVAILRNVNDLTLQRMDDAGMSGLITADMQSGYKGVLGAIGEWLLRVGFVFTVITGLIPSPMSNCGLQPQSVTDIAGDDCFAEVMSNLHVQGIIIGLVLAIIGTFIRIFAPRKIGSEWKGASFSSSPLPVKALVVLSLVFLLAMGVVFLVIYAANDKGAAIEVDFCPHYKSEAACLGQELPDQWYSWAAARKQADFGDKLTVDGWQCEWHDMISTVSTGCVRTNCNNNGRVNRYKLAVVAEFLGLVIGVYGVYFGIWTAGIYDRYLQMKVIGPDRE